MSVLVGTLGFPRIGPQRELKTAVESYWAGGIDAAALQAIAAGIRASNRQMQHALGVTQVPVNDFSLYDHVLDTSVMVGAIPTAYRWQGGDVPLDTYFAMARGSRTSGHACDAHAPALPVDVPALEMTKWFDTNYHYVVPELQRRQSFTLASTKAIDEFTEAKRQGIPARPVLLGPVSYLLLSKGADAGTQPLALLPGLLPVYAEVLQRLATAGAQWVQIDEPCLALDLHPDARSAFGIAYRNLSQAAPGLKILLATYFGRLGDSLQTALQLPVAGLHLDLVRAPAEVELAVQTAPRDMRLSLGIVDGRNIWRTDLSATLDRVTPLADKIGADRVLLGPSCSLLHVPLDLDLEAALDPEIRPWLAFAKQKVSELVTLSRALNEGRKAVQSEIEQSDVAAAARRNSSRTHDPVVRQRLAGVTGSMTQRANAYPVRRATQQADMPLPAFPTTTIGSFPQTAQVRKARAAHTAGTLSDGDYETFLRQQTEDAIRWQEQIGLDVLVHGEFERNDMVQYFGEQLQGYVFTRHAWVQSYGSRCVRPPIIFGDVSRPHAMTVAWAQYAQSLTPRIVKGMLTGPVTMLQWSFVRDDMPRSAVCRQIALALRDEVRDLEDAGIRIIQIDEPALREGLPLRRADWADYLQWAVESFRLCASGVGDRTQIHTHMCYAEFNDIISAIGALDADVISIETARSRMQLLDAFEAYRYPNEIGPGVYDIHAPRCPSVAEMVALAQRAIQTLSPDQIWINPDCGLKTRRWKEVRPALENMVQAARELRRSRS